VQLGVGGEEGGEAGVDDVGGWGRVGEVCRRLGGGFTRAWIAHFQAALEHQIRAHGLKAFHKNTLELKSEIKQKPTHYKHTSRYCLHNYYTRRK